MMRPNWVTRLILWLIATDYLWQLRHSAED